jgi:ketosteroid isomerase-like protein
LRTDFEIDLDLDKTGLDGTLMYHTIVRNKLRQAFRDLDAGRCDSVLAQFAPRFDHVLMGDHALGGVRHSLGPTRRWYERLYQVLPDLRFEPQRIIVTGWPWDTTAIVEWVDRATVAGPRHYQNEGVHVFRLRWGRVVSLRVYCDTARLAAALQAQADGGIAEAAAPPIVEPS